MGAGKPSLPMTGGCACGAIRYEITRFPLLLYTCKLHGLPDRVGQRLCAQHAGGNQGLSHRGEMARGVAAVFFGKRKRVVRFARTRRTSCACQVQVRQCAEATDPFRPRRAKPRDREAIDIARVPLSR
jgi:hypothetical protein